MFFGVSEEDEKEEIFKIPKEVEEKIKNDNYKAGEIAPPYLYVFGPSINYLYLDKVKGAT